MLGKSWPQNSRIPFQDQLSRWVNLSPWVSCQLSLFKLGKPFKTTADAHTSSYSQRSNRDVSLTHIKKATTIQDLWHCPLSSRKKLCLRLKTRSCRLSFLSHLNCNLQNMLMPNNGYGSEWGNLSFHQCCSLTAVQKFCSYSRADIFMLSILLPQKRITKTVMWTIKSKPRQVLMVWGLRDATFLSLTGASVIPWLVKMMLTTQSPPACIQPIQLLLHAALLCKDMQASFRSLNGGNVKVVVSTVWAP